ncbi:hypothetical protein B7C42_06201 [Nocardia cerradoensis]|uniref:Uncharacterized protein n=1 Tax=Nocardia cerradoensis TaxID=85688 RepID=A0A231GZ18_9NOCA|nr:hypothetical protein B7C42_06201 [Nocardia cerradoensis]
MTAAANDAANLSRSRKQVAVDRRQARPPPTPPSADPGLVRTPVGWRLRSTFARRIAELPATTRAQLLLAALDGTGEPFPSISLGELEPAERARLIRVHPVTRGVRFRDPLMRSAVVELSTDRERRETHQKQPNASAAQHGSTR